MKVVDAQCNIKGNFAAQALPAHCLRVVAQRTVQIATLSMHHIVCCVVPAHSARHMRFEQLSDSACLSERSHSI